MATGEKISVMFLDSSHRAAWNELYAAYAEFYNTSLSADSADTVWQWLEDGQLCGAIAEVGGVVCGLAHWQIILRPLHACQIAYLHDVFVHPQTRGKGVGNMLISFAGLQAQLSGCDMMRWATAADNKTAMRLYDHIADKTSWVIYDKRLQ